MDKELQKKFDEAVKPVIKLLREEIHPHAKVIVTTEYFEVVEGLYCNYLKNIENE
ncbi:MAG: hypothetical protein LBH61_05310 [Dysgonamonadaceae bacterium]|jgi:hypothetical protein|nr:hypothetical protein [Dysgonamonadaceae bacterium]